MAFTAWGRVAGDSLTFVAKSANVAAVTRNSVGLDASYCITFTEPIPLERRMSAVFGDMDTHSYATNQMDAFLEQSCPGGLVVMTNSYSSGPGGGDITFMFMVP